MSTTAVGFTLARKTARAELLAGWLNGGYLNIYDGARPASNGGTITTQNLLATVGLTDPAGSVTDGVFEADAIEDVLILATGTAAWARSFDADDGTIADLDVGVNGSSAAIWLDNVSLVEGGLVSVTAFVIAEG